MNGNAGARGDEVQEVDDDHDTADAGDALSDAVRGCVRRYLAELDGELSTDFYRLVLSQVEAPLLEEVMQHTRNNQSRAAQLLGLNRGTLRKKLQLYRLAGDS